MFVVMIDRWKTGDRWLGWVLEVLPVASYFYLWVWREAVGGVCFVEAIVDILTTSLT